MLRKLKNSHQGYLLLDILVGIFIFSLGFAVILGIINSAALANAQSNHYLQAVNLASSAMDELLAKLEEDSVFCYTYLAGADVEKIGNFTQTINMVWETADLLLVTVQMEWPERGEVRDYYLESLFYVQVEG
ncbi:MAG: type IV pilus modification PilV family protein [Desulfitobacteriia bacterium]